MLMRFTALAALGVVLTAAALADDDGDDNENRPPAPPPNWVEFASKAGGYTIRIPHGAEEQTKSVNTTNGPVEVHVVLLAAGDVVYASYFNDNPAIEDHLRNAYMDNLVNGHVREKRGRLVTDDRIIIQGNAARDLTIESPPMGESPAAVHRVRLILAGSRIYQLHAVAPDDRYERAKPLIDAFLGSFAIREVTGEAPDWAMFLNDEGRFSIRMPGEPTRQTNELPGEATSTEIITFSGSRDTVAYLVSYHDTTAPAAKRPRTVLAETERLALEGSQATLDKERSIRLGRWQGREFTGIAPFGSDPEGGRVRGRVYLVGRRVYQILTIAPKDRAESEDIDAFFRSFMLAR